MATLIADTETIEPAVQPEIEAPTVSPVPVGAPKVSFAREVLLTLKERLESTVDHKHSPTPEARAIWDAAHYRLGLVNRALARIEEGKYGQCTECNSSIEPDRLVIRPFTTLCRSCQGNLERKGVVRPDQA